jgi:hypothetical protein
VTDKLLNVECEQNPPISLRASEDPQTDGIPKIASSGSRWLKICKSVKILRKCSPSYYVVGKEKNNEWTRLYVVVSTIKPDVFSLGNNVTVPLCNVPFVQNVRRFLPRSNRHWASPSRLVWLSCFGALYPAVAGFQSWLQRRLVLSSSSVVSSTLSKKMPGYYIEVGHDLCLPHAF